MLARAALASVLVGLLAACSSPIDTGPPPAPPLDVFEAEVYPVLARDCAFAACHGDRRRFFRVFAPGRVRLSGDSGPFDPPTEAEVTETYDRARSMLAGSARVTDSLLLRKPLAAAAGGGSHQGVDAFGQNVFPDRDDARWRAMRDWACSGGASCTDP